VQARPPAGWLSTEALPERALRRATRTTARACGYRRIERQGGRWGSRWCAAPGRRRPATRSEEPLRRAVGVDGEEVRRGGRGRGRAGCAERLMRSQEVASGRPSALIFDSKPQRCTDSLVAVPCGPAFRNCVCCTTCNRRECQRTPRGEAHGAYSCRRCCLLRQQRGWVITMFSSNVLSRAMAWPTYSGVHAVVLGQGPFRLQGQAIRERKWRWGHFGLGPGTDLMGGPRRVAEGAASRRASNQANITHERVCSARSISHVPAV